MNPVASDRLAVAAKGGDRAAFNALIRREKAGLYAFVRRYVGDPDDAYDVVQDAFVAAWRSMGRYDPNRAFGVWLRTIALNKCRDHGRRAKVRRLVLSAFAAEPKAPARADDNPGLARLDAAIAQLPALYKDPLLLTTAGGLSTAEAAMALQTSPKAIEMRLYRARQCLGELMAKIPEG
jgi:RNA polymerase sigma factor (sigma-70 family)